MTTKLYFNELSNQPMIAQLQQLTSLTWDGDLIGKSYRDELVKSGYAQRFNGGWNIITAEGVKLLSNLQFISQ
jgi:predicted transcriptional regulator